MHFCCFISLTISLFQNTTFFCLHLAVPQTLKSVKRFTNKMSLCDKKNLKVGSLWPWTLVTSLLCEGLTDKHTPIWEGGGAGGGGGGRDELRPNKQTEEEDVPNGIANVHRNFGLVLFMMDSIFNTTFTLTHTQVHLKTQIWSIWQRPKQTNKSIN